MNMRLFIAFKINAENELLEAFSDIKQNLNGEKIKWVDTNNIHVTLKFLGDTSKDEVSEINNVIESITSITKPIELRLQDIGFFGKPMNPKIVWVGLQKNYDLLKLHEKLDKSLDEIGFEKDKRRFNPHLTLGRVKYIHSYYDFTGAISPYKDKIFQTETLDKLMLYESTLTPKGPIYNPLKIFKLNH